MVSSMLMMGLYSWFGFAKILGLGHILWIPLLLHVLSQLPNTSGALKAYFIAWCVSTAVSLAFDFADVWKYFAARKSS